MFKIYSKPDCTFCAQAKQLMNSKDIMYEEFLMGRDITREEVLEQFPQMRTMPIIFDGDRLIGGFTQLKDYLKTKGL